MRVPLVPVPPTEPPSDDPFRYGLRYVRVPTPDGGEELREVPLTLEDVLHPQEDDVIPERPVHQLERGYFGDIVRSRPLKPPIYHVTSDCLIDWGKRGLRPHSPDVAVFVGVREEPNLEAGTFHLKESGGRCLMVLEIVSPHTRDNDVVRKIDDYFRAGVPLYVLIDQEREDGPRTLHGYRRSKKGYADIPLSDGRLRLKELGLILFMRDNRLVCADLETGKELGDYVRIAEQLDEADRRIAEQAIALEESVERTRAAQEQARVEAAARCAAEELARVEAAARRAAEEQARTETAARQATEEQMRAEVAARRSAEERIRQLEKMLRRPRPVGRNLDGREDRAMTEAEWQACDDPAKMLSFLKDREALRKWRLLGVALCRSPLPWHHLNRPMTEAEWEDTRPLIEAIEQCADRSALDSPDTDFRHWFDVSEVLHGGTTAEQRIETALVREVFGNPFRVVSLDPSWLTPTVTALACSSYEDRTLPIGTLDRTRLAILADVLEDAGCTDADLLGHLRGPGPHVRGCWALDLLCGQG